MLAERADGPRRARPRCSRCLGCSGGRDALEETVKVVSGNAQALARRRARLLALFDAAAARGLGAVPHRGRRRGSRLRVLHGHDVLDLRGGSGRADRRRRPLRRAARRASVRRWPAVGFGLDLDALAWALRSARSARARPRGRRLRGHRRRRPRGRAPRSRDSRRSPSPTTTRRLRMRVRGGSPPCGAARRSSTCEARPRARSMLQGDADRVAGVVARMLESLPRGA